MLLNFEHTNSMERAVKNDDDCVSCRLLVTVSIIQYSAAGTVTPSVIIIIIIIISSPQLHWVAYSGCFGYSISRREDIISGTERRNAL